jgi:hypothetical protein
MDEVVVGVDEPEVADRGIRAVKKIDCEVHAADLGDQAIRSVVGHRPRKRRSPDHAGAAGAACLSASEVKLSA